MAEAVLSLTSQASSSASPLNPPSRLICHVCHKQFSQYTCPRCNSRYCSLHCYKSHSLRCTESFMRENVVDELQQMQPGDETKQKMLDILKRFHSQEETDSIDEDDSVLSEEIVQKVLSGAPVSFDDLSVKEKKQFQRAMASGELSKLIEPWDPWWLKPSARTIALSKEGTQLVQPLSETKPSSPPQINGATVWSSDIPSGPETPLPPVRKLISVEPSPLLAVHLVDVVYSYCFTLRLYNGDWQQDAIGSAMVVLSISSVVGQAGQPQTVPGALSCCLEQTCSPEYRHMGGLQYGLGLINDVISILSLGGPALICLLCDLRRLFQAGERDLKEEKLRKLRRSEIRSKLKLAERKVYFIMCWVHEQPEEAWSSLASIVRAEKCSAIVDKVNENTMKEENNRDTKGTVLIEEME